ncbi:MAG: thioredoxin family protein [Chthoniobacterales bacterium]
MKKILLLLTVAFASATSLFSAPEIGEAAPAFTLTDSTGTEHSLSDFEGKTVVLEWFNYGCPFVKKHYSSENMQGLQEAAVEDDVVWLTIVSSAPGKQGHLTPEEAEAKREELGSNATALLIDEDGEVGKLYNAKTTPEMFVINGEGNVVYMGAIDSKSDAKEDSIDGAVNYVTAALDAIEADEEIENPKTKPYGCSIKY